MNNVYIHIPFCAQNCSYCTFAKELSVNNDVHTQYVDSLKQEFLHASYIQKGDTLKTLYFGGGTPSLLSVELYKDLFTFLKKEYIFHKDIEVCLEAHPLTVTKEKVQAWKNLGINRVSLGVQTFQKKFDRFLERNLEDTVQAYNLLKESGLKVSIDLIFGFPNQTEADLMADIEELKTLNIEHISWYALDYKPNSKIEDQQNMGLSFDVFEKYYERICTELQQLGLEQYELYNFAKPGVVSQHNYNFWKQEDYIGFGVSAVSQIKNRVQENTQSLQKYVKGNFVENSYDLDDVEYVENFLKRGLRLVQGIDVNELRVFLEKNIKNPERVFKKLHENIQTIPSWVQEKKHSWTLTQEGRMFFEDVIDVLMEGLTP